MAKITLETKDLMDFSDAAKYLKVSRPTIYALVEQGRLHPISLGKVRYLYVTELGQIKKERA
jgi:excisionase family DNA binding protein